MRLYFPEMIANIDRPRERKRLEGISFTAKPKQEKTADAEPPPPPLSASGKVLVLAEAAYSKEDYEKAKGYFLKALEERGEGPDHAKAYYGLARIALRQKDPELAERLLQKTLEMSPDPQTRAWALVYLGRLADATGDREQASRHYQAALAVEGGSDQARKAAEKGIQESYKK
jgi:tetratricopeptide (TPR) repeat protein